MTAARRILGVAGLRLREGLRGPLPAFFGFFLALAAVAVLLAPGEGGPDRQRVVDGLALDAALFVSALAAATLGASSLAGDRESGREPVLSSGPLRRHEALLGGLLGHAAGIALLLAVQWLAAGALTALAGAHRAPTCDPLRASELTDGEGRPAPYGIVLGSGCPEAVYVLDAGRDALEAGAREGRVRAWVFLQEYVADIGIGLPVRYDVGVTVGGEPERVVTNRSGSPLEFDLAPEQASPDGLTPIRIRHLDPAYRLGLIPSGLVAQGPPRSFLLNLGKALAGWFLGLLVLAAAGTALSTVVGPAVGTAGALLLGLLGRSVPLLEEASFYLGREQGAAAALAAKALERFAWLVPDYQAFDLSLPVVSRWDIGGADLAGLLGPAAIGVAVFLGLAWLALALGRLR